MKKIISVLFALCICLSLSAQEHMKFMGIPIDGTIDNFTLKLKAKGVEYNAEKSKALPPGGRIFSGTFMGDKATFIVFYNVKSKNVYSVGVALSYPNVEYAHPPFMNIAEQLQDKYPHATSEVSKDSDGDVEGLAFNIPDKSGKKKIGDIFQTLSVSDSYQNGGCTILLTYTDVENFQKSEAINNEDL